MKKIKKRLNKWVDWSECAHIPKPDGSKRDFSIFKISDKQTARYKSDSEFKELIKNDCIRVFRIFKQRVELRNGPILIGTLEVSEGKVTGWIDS